MLSELKAKLPHDEGCYFLAPHSINAERDCNCTRREILEWVEANEISNKQWAETMADLVKSIKDNAPPVLFQAILSGVERHDR